MELPRFAGEELIRESPVPPGPNPADVLNPAQWDTLMAIADTIIPCISAISATYSDNHIDQTQFDHLRSTLGVSAATDKATAEQNAVRYLEERASSIPGFKESLGRTLGLYVHHQGRKGISSILQAMNNRAVSILLTGRATPFQRQPYHVRVAILQRWQNSYIPSLRAAQRALTALCRKTWVTLSPTLPLVLGFPRTPVHYHHNEGFPHSFLQFPPGSEPETIEADIVIVGSGCGAGVAAKNLVDAGYKVVVVEKSYFFPNSHFPMTPSEGMINLFANGGAEMSDDGSIGVISGSTWGGGGTVNWSASLQTQSMVRQEWGAGGLPFFTSSEFQDSLDRVCNYMGVTTNIDHNYGNRVILEGARKLGYTAKEVPQNTGNQSHYCGYCTLGCSSGIKQGPAVSFLADAAKGGATFIEGFEASRVLFRDLPDGTKLATGVKGTWKSRDINGGISGHPTVTRSVVISAKKVVVSCGTLQSPLLLHRSGVVNSQLGRNLHLHPVSILTAVFDEDIRPWEGGILTSLATEFENLDGQGHGTKIETVVMLPNFILPLFPWKDGLDYKVVAAKLRNMVGFISLTRDRDTGRVYPDPADGRCRIEYTPSLFDRKHILEGLIGSAKIAYVSGAKEIRASSSAVPDFIRPERDGPDQGINDAGFQAWVKELRASVPLPVEESMFASAHQMGTCRMGTAPKNSVVDPTGMVWGTKGLYVADASVFPSASGVNPMVTNMAISDWTSRKLAETLSSEKVVVPKSRL
ncbi:hypothetical protein FQN57_000189 [Myotisia sp. PD_48]|nr:hypothetical protein FQN57_000189 [Myotisia sp. PD_48]